MADSNKREPSVSAHFSGFSPKPYQILEDNVQSKRCTQSQLKNVRLGTVSLSAEMTVHKLIVLRLNYFGVNYLSKFLTTGRL